MNDWIIFGAVFFSLVIGWGIGRYQGLFHFNRPTDEHLPSKYYKGLNYLLNEQPDQAIHHFITLLEDDSESIELQMVLATLFRKQGELDRAIAIHQRLLVRPDLSDKKRQRVHVELAQDYFSGGLHDRAEQLLTEALDSEDPEHALELLFSIWEEHKDWQKIVKTGQSFKHLSRKLSIRFVGACCKLSQSKNANAYEYLNLAEQYCSDSIMLHYFYAETHLKEGHPRKALKRLKRLVHLDQSTMPLTLPLLKQCFDQKALWLTSFRKVLEEWYQLSPSISVVKELLLLIAEQESRESALIFLTEYLKIRPSIPGLVQLVDLHLKSEQPHDQATMIMFRNLCTQILDERSQYQCQKCGYQAHKMYWQCPNCRKWETVRPVFGIDAE